MTRILTITITIVVSSVIFCGCQEANLDAPRFQADPAQVQFVQQEGYFAADTQEVALVEKLASSRAEYQNDLFNLKSYYFRSGGYMKYRWAAKEAVAFDKAPKYKYLMAAETATADLVASDAIPSADRLYEEAMELYRDAVVVPNVPIKSKMRKAIAKLNKLINDYPTSDKIDDAAYRAGELYERFKDWNIAVTNYQRAFQWDDMTPYPARYKAARILDKRLARRDEALTLYSMSVEKEARFGHYKNKAIKRINQLTITEPEAEDVKDVAEAREEQIELEQIEQEQQAVEIQENTEEQ